MLHLSMSSFDAQKLHLVEERASVRMGGDAEFRDDLTANFRWFDTDSAPARLEVWDILDADQWHDATTGKEPAIVIINMEDSWK